MKVLIVGDSPHIKTGFGKVNLIAAKHFQSQGWEVASVAGLTEKPPEDDLGIRMFVPEGMTKGDPLGVREFEKAVAEFKPDLAYMTADTGSVVLFSRGLPDMPSFSYMPIEGEPIVNRWWKVAVNNLPFMTTSQYGAGVVKQQFNLDIDYAYHGVDHDIFKVTGIRDDIRRTMGWEDKFVIMCVSTNVRRKQLPRLMEALALLKHEFKQKDIILYLHTVPFQNHWLEGWNLMDIATMYQVDREVYFNPQMSNFNSFVPETTGDPTKPGLVELYNGADLFILPSQVEGFGLPIAEAMACGLPVMVTKYAAGWEVASPAGRGIQVSDWEVHKSGTIYANINPRALAQEVLRLKRNPKDRQRMSEASLRRASDFQWTHFTDKLIPAVEQAIVTHQERRASEQAKDQVNEPKGNEEEHLSAYQAEDSAGEVNNLTVGQGEDIIIEASQDGPVASQEEA